MVKQVYPRSYEVLTEDNKTLRRNRQHLLPTGEAFIQDALEDDHGTEECQQSTHAAPNLPEQINAPPVMATDPTTSLRRSRRQVRPPQRLQYDSNFQQLS